MERIEKIKQSFKQEFRELEDRLELVHERLEDLRTNRSGKSAFGYLLRQKEVAQILDIIPQNYHKIERGKDRGGNMPTLYHVVKLSRAYGVSTDYLLTGHESILGRVQDEEKSKEAVEKDRALEDVIESQKKIIKLLEDKIDELVKK